MLKSEGKLVNLHESRNVNALIVILSFVIFPSSPTEPMHPGLPQEDILASVSACIRNGQADRLAEYFSETLDIGLPGSDKTYSRSQGELVMKDFFRKYPPTSFKEEQHDTPSPVMYFTIGTYASGQSHYQALIVMKKEAANWKVHKLKFEEK